MNSFIPVLTLLLVFIGGIALVSSAKTRTVGKILVTFAIAAVTAFLTFFGALLLSFSNRNAYFYIIVLIAFAVLILLILSFAIFRILKRKLFISLLCGILLCVLSAGGYALHERRIDSLPTVGESDGLLTLYAPYAENTRVALLNEKADIEISDDIPILDGATALYPIYSAFARAVYPRDKMYEDTEKVESIPENNFLRCSTTTGAYFSIVDGSADIIFVAAPSEKQKSYAEDNGVTLEFTPIGKEAFVFFVNAENPIENITLEQIRAIYSGETVSWKELGIDGFGKIRAFQRDEGSGSQSALQRLMGDKPLAAPPRENVIDGMGGIIKKTADYRNYKNAIGYSFRFYSTEMVKNNSIKLLSVNGVYPNANNIENGTYPIASEFFAVTRSDKSENTARLLNWITNTQGQLLVKKTGYTPIK